MADDSIPDDVRECLRAHIETYDQLEALLFLIRSPGGGTTSENLAVALHIPVEAATAALDHLCQRQLLSTETQRAGRTFRYNPALPAIAETVTRLARAYDESRLEIVKIMNANAIERVRTAAIRTFADAFILGEKKDDG